MVSAWFRHGFGMVSMSKLKFTFALFMWMVAISCVGAIDSKWGPWIPSSPGWSDLMRKREIQVDSMRNGQERFDAAINLVLSGVLLPNFTDVGWAVIKTPPNVHQKLYSKLHSALKKAGGKDGLPREHKVDQISGNLPGFVQIGSMAREIMADLKPLHEQWVGGMELIPNNAYGLRLYEDGNTLTMHTDHVDTHVISSIVHVDHDTDEPWPIVIEGFDGKTMEVALEPGEMLFYESAKCVHGRPRPMKGRWYTSLFVHYRPKQWPYTTPGAIKYVEKFWPPPPPLENFGGLPELRMVGTGMKEPGCANQWCNLAKQWPPSKSDSGKGEEL